MRITAIAAACLVLVGIATASDAEAAIRRTTSIPAQGLAPALESLAKERDFQILYVTDVVSDLRTGGALGELTVDEAMTQLLTGTGLTFRYVDERTVTIVPAYAQPVAPARRAGQATGPAANEAGERETAIVPASDESDSARAESVSGQDENAADSDASPGSTDTARGMPEVLVKGSRSLNTDIRRTEDDIQPYVVFDREAIERSMDRTLEDFLKTRLPMNTIQLTNAQQTFFGSTGGNRSSVDLRGLGTDETLVLIDGRRAPGVSLIESGGGIDQPDINGIPLNAIERIEVLPATAGGIYGGSATAGVINIILKRDYSGVDVAAVYGNTFDSDAENVRIDLNAGFALEGGKTHVTISGSHSESKVLLEGDRDFARRGRALLLANNALLLNSPSFRGPPIGYTTNVCGASGGIFGFFCDGSELVLDDGTPLGASETSVPVGYGGVATDDGTALLDRAGQYNLDIPNTLGGSQNSLINNPTIQSLQAGVRREFGPSIEAYIDFSLFDNQGRTRTARVPTFVGLEADDPGNPFTTPVLVSFPSPGLSFESRHDSEQRRGSLGTIVRLPRGWTAAADYVLGRASSYHESTTPVVDVNDFIEAVRSGELDIFRDLNVDPLDLSPYLLPSPNNFDGPFDTELRDASLKLAGSAWQLPAGAIAVTALVERRKEKALEGYTEGLKSSFTGEPVVNFYPERSQSVNSYYLEMLVPLFASANPRTGVRELELQAAVRHDDYETLATSANNYPVDARGDRPADPIEYTNSNVSSTDYTFGMRYSPIRGLALRASYGTAFLPPNVVQIVPSQPFVFPGPIFFLPDPKRGGELVGFAGGENITVSYLGGGNPDLLPEKSESWSAGIVLTPGWAPGLRLSVDYTLIDKVNEISTLAFEEILEQEDTLDSRVIRGPNLPGDDPSWPGPVIGIDSTLVNISTTRVEAFDIQADYGWTAGRFGSFTAFAIATHQTKFERQTLADSPLIDAVNFSDGPLEWRGNFGLTWDRGPWTLGWNAQYYDSYKVYSSTTPHGEPFFPGDPDFPGSPIYGGTIEHEVFNQGSATIASQTYHDLFARYRVGATQSARDWLSGVDVMIGVQNIFNDSPPILATAEPSGGYSTYGDPRLRRYTLTLRKSF